MMISEKVKEIVRKNLRVAPNVLGALLLQEGIWQEVGDTPWAEIKAYRNEQLDLLTIGKRGESPNPTLSESRLMGSMTIKELQVEACRAATEHGFHKGEPNIWKFIGNLHSECSEAWEEVRKPDFEPKRTYYRDDGKPEGLPIELADILIRVGDTAEVLGIDLEAAVREKMAYNETRPHLHGGKRA